MINYLGGNTTYLVPNDMFLYVLHVDSWISGISATGTTYNPSSGNAITPLVFQPGSSISSPHGINGLLIPTDYCVGGGNSSLVSSVDSTMVAEMITNALVIIQVLQFQLALFRLILEPHLQMAGCFVMVVLFLKVNIL